MTDKPEAPKPYRVIARGRVVGGRVTITHAEPGSKYENATEEVLDELIKRVTEFSYRGTDGVVRYAQVPIELLQLGGSAVKVYAVLAKTAQGKPSGWLKRKTIAQEAGLGLTAVDGALKQLAEAGVITCSVRMDHNRRQALDFTLHVRVAGGKVVDKRPERASGTSESGAPDGHLVPRNPGHPPSESEAPVPRNPEIEVENVGSREQEIEKTGSRSSSASPETHVAQTRATNGSEKNGKGKGGNEEHGVHWQKLFGRPDIEPEAEADIQADRNRMLAELLAFEGEGREP